MTQTNKKRKWEEFFMGNAFLAAKRSKNPKTQLGACIISEENYTVGVGYNNMTKGMEYLEGSNINDSNLYECHAVLNAILNKNKAELNNCKIYVNSFPCNKCIKSILQSGINEIVYAKDGTGINPVSKKMLDEANIKYRHWHSMSEDNKIVLSCRKMDL
ncbi:PREDICTED: deoxycytidylate deaminase-like [Nicrophorus vespilloides]|uniref:dCMP deaminase n=1 Tax=Nicrophorus vespilloides TaxID=110193 RepID=A0ABM1NEJ9_NICVS|nr:PREDICTED: deoxycytidylate deaminase-like [Nicrophorus vespilloides]